MLGSILTLDLFGLAYQAYRIIVSSKLVIVAAVWASDLGSGVGDGFPGANI